MNMPDLVRKARTCRHFQPNSYLSEQNLVHLLNCARLCPSARNLQPLHYTLLHSPEACRAMFPLLAMGGALKPEQRPGPDNAPGGYIVIWGPEKMDEYCAMDVGIAAQTINLAATEQGFACCMVGNFSKSKVSEWLMPQNALALQPLLVIAIGKPAMECTIDSWNALGTMDGERRLPYYQDTMCVHHVPKRNLEDIVLALL